MSAESRLEFVEIVGVRIGRQGPVQFFEAAGHRVVPGDVVCVPQAGHQTLGRVVFAPVRAAAELWAEPPPPLPRTATSPEAAGDVATDVPQLRLSDIRLAGDRGVDLSDASVAPDPQAGGVRLAYRGTADGVALAEVAAHLAARWRTAVELRAASDPAPRAFASAPDVEILRIRDRADAPISLDERAAVVHRLRAGAPHPYTS